MDMMNSIQPLLNTYLPMSLVPSDSLLAVLEDVATEQWRQNNGTSLAIPIDENVAY